MADVTDEAAAQREADREQDGRFGVASHTEPEMGLVGVGFPDYLLDLQAAANEARDRRSAALIDYIDAAMPDDADMVNYEYHPTANYLVIDVAAGDFGVMLDKERFTHISDALRKLGEPYRDYNGDHILNELEEFGWVRTAHPDAERTAAAIATMEEADADWHRAMNAQQDAAKDELIAYMGEHIEALDFTWSAQDRALKVTGAVHSYGRSTPEEGGSKVWDTCNAIAAFIPEADLSALVRSELTGEYRLTRPS